MSRAGNILKSLLGSPRAAAPPPADPVPAGAVAVVPAGSERSRPGDDDRRRAIAIATFPTTEAFGGGAAAVANQRSLVDETIGTAAAATRAIANRVASLEPEVVVQRAPGSEPDALPAHPHLALLGSPHPNLTRSQWLFLQCWWLLSAGEGYAVKARDGFGAVRELHPIPPWMMTPFIRGNVVERYRVTDANGRVSILDPRDVLRFWLPDPASHWRARGYLAPSALQTDILKFSAQHSRRHYQHDATPKMALEAQENATAFQPEEWDEFTSRWIRSYSARRGTSQGAPALIPTGYRLVRMALMAGQDPTPIMEAMDRTLLRYYGVPKSVLGEVVSGDRSSAETNDYVFDSKTVAPIAKLFEDEFTRGLAREADPRLSIRWCPWITRDKASERAEELHRLTTGQALINDLRQERGEEDVEWGDEPLLASNIGLFPDPDAVAPVPAAPVPGSPQPTPDQGAEDAANPPRAWLPPETDDVDADEARAHAAVRRRAKERKRQRGTKAA